MLQAIEGNSESIRRARHLIVLYSSLPSWFLQKHPKLPNCASCYQNIAKHLIQLSKFLRWSLLIFIIKVFRTIVFIFIVISITFQPIYPPAFRCLSNSGTFTELRTTSFIETTGVACSDSVCHEYLTLVPGHGKRNQNRRPPWFQ